MIVAEKPSVARDLARVLGVRPAGQHGFEGTGRVITWCVGHLVELDEPAAYDPRWRAWRLDTLPMLPAASLMPSAWTRPPAPSPLWSSAGSVPGHGPTRCTGCGSGSRCTRR